MGGFWACFRYGSTWHLVVQCSIKLDASQCCQIVSCAIGSILDMLDREGALAVFILHIATVIWDGRARSPLSR